MPLVSIVIPTHNRPELLAEALASVKAQTFTDYEIIVVSNGESAEMRECSRAIAAKVNAVWFGLRRGNLSVARNFGVEQACGEWIAFLDDDDIWLPAKLERQIAIAGESSADLIASDYLSFYDDGKEIEWRPRVPEGWCWLAAVHNTKWWALPSATLARRSAIIAAGGFDPHQRHGEDTDLWRRIAWRHRIYQMDEILVRYRRGHGTMMQREREACFYGIRAMLKLYLDTPRDLRATLPPTDGIWVRLAMICLPRSTTDRIGLTRWSDVRALKALVPQFLK